MTDILITENIKGPAIKELKKKFNVDFQPDIWQSPETLQSRIKEAKGLIVRNQTKVTREIIDAGPLLKVIGRAGAGLDNIDVKAASDAGIVVAYTPEQNAISVAELTLGMMLSLARHLGPADKDTRAGNWHRHRFTGSELYGKTLGIVGMGRIGFRTAARARAFGMDIIAHDDYVNPHATSVSELRASLVPLSELLARADFVSCHLPLTHQTRELFDYEKFCRMKPTAFFLNTSRGEIVDETGLLRALKEDKIAGAGLDVRKKEPPETDSLSSMAKVILTPHIAAFTREGQHRVVTSVCQDVAAVLNGKPAKNVINFSTPKR